jgi:hypothetical protein
MSQCTSQYNNKKKYTNHIVTDHFNPGTKISRINESICSMGLLQSKTVVTVDLSVAACPHLASNLTPSGLQENSHQVCPGFLNTM